MIKIKTTPRKELVKIFARALDQKLCYSTVTGNMHACQVAVFRHDGELEDHDRVRLCSDIDEAESLASSFERLVGTPSEAAGNKILAYVSSQLA